MICSLLSRTDSIYFDTERADRLSTGMELLERKNFEVVLSDLGLPDSMGVETFLKLHSRHPDVPIIVLTGLDDENAALSAVNRGAQDYLVKGKIDTGQLIRSIRYAIERQKLIAELEKSIKEIKTLRGLLPMCAWCRNIRDDQGYWKDLETYIEEHTDAAFSHGICPKCMKEINPALYEKLKREDQDLEEQERKQDEQSQSNK